MKKYIKIFLVAVILVLSSTLIVNAADATATLKLSDEQVKKGDTFTVTVNVSCEEGINGLVGNVSYDTEKLEFIGLELIDTQKWFNMSGEKLKFEIVHNAVDTETSADIIKATFKVKDTAQVGTTAKVTIADIELDSDAATNSNKQIGTKEVEVSIIEETINDEPGNDEPGNNEPGNNEPGNDNPGNSQQGDNKQENNKGSEGTKTPTKTPDKTTTTTILPKTGVYSIIGVVAIALIIMIIFYKKYNKYKGV